MKFEKVIFLLASISQPRCIKRIESFISSGHNVVAYGFDRGIYNKNVNIAKLNIEVIGSQEDGQKYLKKFFLNQRAIRSILKTNKNEGTVIYSFGFALTLSLILCRCKSYIYEISDILYANKKFSILSWLLREIDKYVIRKSILTIFTSAGFVEYYFKNCPPTNILIQPNKLNILFKTKERPKPSIPPSSSNLIFSYIGAFRYPNTIFRFARIIGEYYPKHKFYFYGDSDLTNEVEQLSCEYNNVKYLGPFINPDDLSEIYSNINIVVACYDIQSLNERIAEPNKLYEALYFCKPIIVSKNTFLSDRVRQLDCGFAIDASNDKSIISFIDSMNVSELERVINNINKIDLDEVIDDNSKNIIRFLNHL